MSAFIRSHVMRSLDALSLMCVMALTGCEAGEGPDEISANSGSTLTTTENQQLTQDMFLGKWDLDGELTNTANGNGGVLAIPSDIVKDVMGKGWRLEPNGVLRTDDVIGSKPGTWKIEGTNTLVVTEADMTTRKYQAQFKNGYMYLKRPDGKYMVMEKDKFFGF